MDTSRRAIALGRVTRELHRIDHAVGRLASRRRVLVEFRMPVYQAILGPIGAALADDPRIEVRYTSEYPERIAPLVPAGAFLGHKDVEWRRVDLYINGDPWAAATLRRCAHRINFFHGVAGKYDLDRPDGLPLGFDRYDRVGFINRDRMQRYLDAGIVTPAQAVLIGFPKLDRLARGAFDRAAVRDALELDRGRPTVLYAPTFSTASSLYLAGEAIVCALEAAGFNVVIKLHDRSLDPDPRFTGGIDWRRKFAAIARPGRIVFTETPDGSPLLAAADLMVTDHSSIGFEYLVRDRPLLVFDAPGLAEAARINPQKIELLRSAATVAGTPEDLAAAARREMAEPTRLSPARRRVAAEMFHDPGRATERAVALARSFLALRRPVRAAGEAIGTRAGCETTS